MAVPKRRTSRAKGKSRRANHDKVTAPNVVACTNCGAPSLAHRVCKACGFYKGKQIKAGAEEVLASPVILAAALLA